MIKITAAAPPSIFGFYRANRATYAQLAGDDALRKALFDEQGGLCAYCERRLAYAPSGPHSTRIEHFHPQNPAAASTLHAQACRSASGATQLAHSGTTWTNLLLCCNGQATQGSSFQHCDVTKRDTDICSAFRNPKTFPAPRLLEVLPNGTIVPMPGMPKEAGRVVDEVLMLNRKSLTTVRRQLYRALIGAIASEKRRRPFGMTVARRNALRATLETHARDGAHPSVALSVAQRL